MVTPEHLARTLNIGLDKANQMIRIATQCVICTAVHHFSRRYRIDHLDLHCKYISGRWYIDWIPASTRSITQFKDVFVYYNGKLLKVDPKKSKKIMQGSIYA